MKSSLLTLLSKTTKHSAVVRKNREMYDWVMSVTMFLPESASLLERIYCAANDITDISCCAGTVKQFSGNLNVGYRFCGRATKCVNAKMNQSLKISAAKNRMLPFDIAIANEKRRLTLLKKYGVEFNSQINEVKEKKKHTCVEKFGASTNLLSSDTLKKIKQTMVARYGVEAPMQSASILAKTQRTNLLKYGNICAAQDANIRAKISESHNEKYGVNLFHKNRFTSEQIAILENQQLFQDEFAKLGLTKMSDKYGFSAQFLKFRLNRWGIEYDKNLTTIEDFIKQILDEHNVEYSYRNRKLISPNELDFVIPSLGVAIEVGGLYWHSDKFADKNYHKMKMDRCNAVGYKLLTIFSDEIQQSPDAVKSRILHLLKKNRPVAYARKCEVREISSNEANTFLSTHHTQGSAASTIRIGAFFNKTLVAVMTFSKNRKITGDKSDYVELVRFATCGSVVGIASKMLNFFITVHSPLRIISYADRRWSEGDLYKTLGFELVKTSGPNYSYTKDCKTREHRFKFTKSRLVSLGADPLLTEQEIMTQYGYRRVWDCGTLRFEYDVAAKRK